MRTLRVNLAHLLTLLAKCEAVPVHYRLGAKAEPLSSAPADLRFLDCSGFVRWALFHAGTVAVPDGSVQMHDWVKAQGFKPSSVAAAKRQDDLLRIAFLSPQAGGGEGHVVLVLNGRTLESYGGHGPGRRPWDGDLWQARCDVFCLSLTPPTKGKTEMPTKLAAAPEPTEESAFRFPPIHLRLEDILSLLSTGDLRKLMLAQIPQYSAEVVFNAAPEAYKRQLARVSGEWLAAHPAP